MNTAHSLSSWLRRERGMLSALLSALPPMMTGIFIASVIAMNLLARITLVSLPFLALNAGILVSWLAFLFLDIVAKHFDARAADSVAFLALLCNLVFCLICVILSRACSLPGLDMVVGGQWSVLLASSIAYVLSCVVNNRLNVSIGRRFRADPDGAAAYAARSFISTFAAQIVDNFLFVFLAFVVFPNLPGALNVHWTVPQCVGAAVLCALFELATEVVTAPIGFAVLKSWRKNGQGREYLAKYCPQSAA